MNSGTGLWEDPCSRFLLGLNDLSYLNVIKIVLRHTSHVLKIKCLFSIQSNHLKFLCKFLVDFMKWSDSAEVLSSPSTGSKF